MTTVNTDKFVNALRRKFASPRAVLEQLGIDSRMLLDDVLEERNGNLTGRRVSVRDQMRTEADPKAGSALFATDRPRRRGARDVETVLFPSEEDVDRNERQAGVDDEREENGKHLFELSPEAAYDRLIASGHLTHDEAVEFLQRFHPLGYVPRNAMKETGGAVGRREPWRSPNSGVDESPALMRTGSHETLADHRAAIGKDYRCLGGRDSSLLSFASNQRPQVRPKIASDAASSSFYSMFPEAARLVSDGGS